MNDLVLITFTILLPIAPAYILYKALPSQANVEGPFNGLAIRLSGAFGGYFLLVLVIVGFLTARPQLPKARYEVWAVKGQINQDGTPIDPQRLRLSLVPANQTVIGDGSFDIQIAPEVTDAGKLKFPTLVIEHPDFQPVSINLNETQAKFGQQIRNISMDIATKEIAVNGPIDLKKKIQLPPYDPSGQQPQQAVLVNQEAKR